jgi:hypothetical protein
VTDRQLNEYIEHLLDTPKSDRVASNGRWAESFDSAIAMWCDRHPDTRPPAFAKLGPPPPCFTGTLPPIYDGDLDDKNR